MTETPTIDMAGSVTLAYLHSNEVAHSWHLCVLNLLTYDLQNQQRIARGSFMATRCGTGGIVEGRNAAVERFLKTDAEWLMWVDTDMGFAPDSVERLIASADPVERPIVGGLCFTQKETETDGMGGFRTQPSPTVFKWVDAGEGRQGFTPWYDYPSNEVIPVAATGSAFILIHRTVLEKLGEDGPHWYSRLTNPSTNQLLSEDLSFCGRAVAAGFPIYVDTSVKTTHMKTQWVSEADYRWAASRG
jgi:GT2 family glycosyltransferase